VLDLTRSYAESQSTEGAMGGRVAVSAHDCHAWLGQSELRADDMHDPLLRIAHGVQADTELRAVAAKRVYLGARHQVSNGLVDVERGDVVVLRGQGQIWPTHPTTGRPQSVESLRTGHLMDQMQVDEQQIRFVVGTSYDVALPDLLCQCAGHVHPTLCPLVTVPSHNVRR